MPKKINESAQLSRDFPLLKLISLLPNRERDLLVAELDHKKCRSFYSCVHQSLTNRTLEPEWRQKLKTRLGSKKEIFRQLRLDNKVSQKNRHKALTQTGGDLSFILEGVLPLLKEYINSKKK
jgi:hypothetical protein